MRIATSASILVAVALAFPVGCGERAAIHGIVHDNFEKPLAGATVSIVNSGYSATTDADGSFTIDYAPGAFTISFAKPGYSSIRAELNIATKTSYPMSPTILVKHPHAPGMYLQGPEDYVPLAPSIVVSSKQEGGMASKMTYFVNGVEATSNHAIALGEALAKLGEKKLVVVDNAEISRPAMLYEIRESRIGVIEAGLMGSKKSEFIQVDEADDQIEGFWVRKLSLQPKDVLGGGRYCFVQSGRNMLGQELILDKHTPTYCLTSRSGD